MTTASNSPARRRPVTASSPAAPVDSSAAGADNGTPANSDDGVPASSNTGTPDAAGEAAAAREPEPDEDVDARVLIAFDEHDVNDVITAPAAVIGRLAGAGQVDPHPDAVAYALSL